MTGNKTIKSCQWKFLDVIWKLSAPLTLFFLIGSYFYSVKPVFDKTIELNNSKDTINELSILIDIKEAELKNFKYEIESIEIESSLLKEEIKTLNFQKNMILIELDESKTELENSQAELDKKERMLLNANRSAVRANLEVIKNEIANKYFSARVSNEPFKIREYAKEYAESFKTDDKHAIEAKKVLIEYSEYEGENDIDNSIFFLIVFYDYEYSKTF